MSTRFKALKQAKAEGNAWDKFYGKDPVCPHCGTTINVADHELWNLYEDGEHEIECPSCDEDFTVSTRVSYSFSTEEQDMDEEQDPTGISQSDNRPISRGGDMKEPTP